MIKAAIIDDGAPASMFGKCVSYSIMRDLKVNVSSPEAECGIHAEMCMAVMNRYLKNDEIEWLNICIIDHETCLGSRKQLIKALEFCLENDVKVIHMSIGSTEFEDFPEIEAAVNRLTEKGTIIVAALSNSDKITYPACLENVIGVKTTEALKDDKLIYVEDSLENTEFLAASKQLVKRLSGYHVTQYSNSYAAPVVTAKVLNALRENSDLNVDEMKKLLIADSEVRPFVIPKNVGDTEISVPVIGLCLTDDKKVEEIASELRIKFIRDGYDAVMCTVGKKGLFGFYVKNTVEHLDFLIRFSACDIVIAVINESAARDSEFDFDIIIADKKYNGAVNTCEFIEYSDSIKDNIYDMIINKFSE
ncbi:S8 family serine peptidase [uncultured Ruminococcus sp.]|uniref:S8 family serine peptidase n=1 Tax=uncultured Ruminococcus sp. TaxID=165186 RepID=UPI0025EDF2F5|nr:S8 family serine peptidase [uncultured Ruminococcus sp.]